MDIPIKLNIFTNLEYYLLLQRIDDLEKKRIKTRNSLWEYYEKRILLTIGKGFKLYGREITVDWILEQPEFKNEPKGNEGQVDNAIENLIVKGFVSDDRKLTKEGYQLSLLMNELDSKKGAYLKYRFYICLSWVLFFSGVIALISGAILAIAQFL